MELVLADLRNERDRDTNLANAENAPETQVILDDTTPVAGPIIGFGLDSRRLQSIPATSERTSLIDRATRLAWTRSYRLCLAAPTFAQVGRAGGPITSEL